MLISITSSHSFRVIDLSKPLNFIVLLTYMNDSSNHVCSATVLYYACKFYDGETIQRVEDRS